MKKSATWYLLALAMVNILLAIGTCYLAMGWTNGIRILGPMHDFTATRDYLWFSW